jgi:hypothetical protein
MRVMPLAQEKMHVSTKQTGVDIGEVGGKKPGCSDNHKLVAHKTGDPLLRQLTRGGHDRQAEEDEDEVRSSIVVQSKASNDGRMQHAGGLKVGKGRAVKWHTESAEQGDGRGKGKTIV